jgi:hypothetical protein
MKKVLLLLVIVVSLGNLYAQDDVVLSKFYIGGKIGYGSVSFESTDETEGDFAERTFLNFSYGIVAGYRINSKITIQTEGVYAQYSADNIKYEYIYSPTNPLIQLTGETSWIDHVDMDLFYMDIPLIFKYNFGGRTLTPYAYAGVNWGINIQGYTTITRATSDPYGGILYSEYVDGITEQINYYDFAPIIGGGVNMNLGDKITIFGDLRYKYGVQNISNVQNGLGYKNNALWLSAGLVLNL